MPATRTLQYRTAPHPRRLSPVRVLSPRPISRINKPSPPPQQASRPSPQQAPRNNTYCLVITLIASQYRNDPHPHRQAASPRPSPAPSPNRPGRPKRCGHPWSREDGGAQRNQVGRQSARPARYIRAMWYWWIGWAGRGQPGGPTGGSVGLEAGRGGVGAAADAEEVVIGAEELVVGAAGPGGREREREGGGERKWEG